MGFISIPGPVFAMRSKPKNKQTLVLGEEMRNLIMLIAVGSVSLLSADQYSSCSSGQCGGGNYGQQPYYRQGSSDNYQQRSGYNQQRDRYRQDSRQDSRQDQYRQDQYGQDQYRQDRQDQYSSNDDYDHDNDDNDDNDGGDIAAQNDLALFKRIKQALSSYDDVFFVVNNGSVTLRGFVEKVDHKNQVEKNVRDIQGVKNVIDKIKSRDAAKSANASSQENAMGQDQAATPQDRQLNARIRERLSQWMSKKNIDSLVIRTNNGMVVLVGTVDKPEDAQKATEHVKAIEGVKRVEE